jgi:hypothetical protein
MLHALAGCCVQLDELARITLGVCLFNRSVGRGGLALPPGAASYLPQVREEKLWFGTQPAAPAAAVVAVVTVKG